MIKFSTAVNTYQLLQLRQRGYHILPVAWPVCARVAQQVELLQEQVGLQAVQRQQPCLGHKVDCEVELLQGLAALQVLQLGDVVDC
jgi:hypothetical protein